MINISSNSITKSITMAEMNEVFKLITNIEKIQSDLSDEKGYLRLSRSSIEKKYNVPIFPIEKYIVNGIKMHEFFHAEEKKGVYVFTVKSEHQFIKHLDLVVEVPEVKVDDFKVKFNTYPGLRLLREAVIRSKKATIDTISKYTLFADMYNGDEMPNVGQEKPIKVCLSDGDNNLYVEVANGPQTFKSQHDSQKWIIPLKFWDYQKPLPIIDRNDVTVTVQLNKLSTLLVKQDSPIGEIPSINVSKMYLRAEMFSISPLILFSVPVAYQIAPVHHVKMFDAAGEEGAIDISNAKMPIIDITIIFKSAHSDYGIHEIFDVERSSVYRKDLVISRHKIAVSKSNVLSVMIQGDTSFELTPIRPDVYYHSFELNGHFNVRNNISIKYKKKVNEPYMAVCVVKYANVFFLDKKNSELMMFN